MGGRLKMRGMRLVKKETANKMINSAWRGYRL